LIETATEEIAAMILGTHGHVASVAVTLEKPEALRGRALHGAVTIRRERGERPSRASDFGREEILLETSEATLSLFHLDPGKSLAEVAERPERRLGWLVGGHLGVDHALHDPSALGRVLREVNRGNEQALVFVCALQKPSDG
jgi:hypothetical protein